LSGHESDALEVVAEGGSMPTPAMLAWARELQIGSWFELDYRGKQESVQLAWSGLQQQLLLFVTPAGRGILFQCIAWQRSCKRVCWCLRKTSP